MAGNRKWDLPPKYSTADSEAAPCYCPFHTLPIELVARVFSYLDIFEISWCSMVCKRWEVIANHSPLVRKSVIIDIHQWYTNQLDGFHFEDEDSCFAVNQGESLLRRFMTRSTGLVILRWPLDYYAPEAELVIRAPDECRFVSKNHYSSDYSGPVTTSIDNILIIVKNIQRHLGNTSLALTLQNVKLYTNHWHAIRDRFSTVHYDNVQINCHFEPIGRGRHSRPKPVVLRIELDRKTFTQADIRPGCNDYERFGSFIPAPLSDEEERCMGKVLRSPRKIGHNYPDYWKRYFGRDVNADRSLCEMELTVDEILTYPLWKQYFARDLLQQYPVDTYGICADSHSGVSAVQRSLGPFEWLGSSSFLANAIAYHRFRTTVSKPLW
ncbi:uncharacterized protein LOC129591428 [Paramacrobiotus metropolitanus]|uniref:uncharacterized protein LOC129591428 n=1 Tax=Paramacrobiotus metropolitanus TaxID=2943436 RepID=UPI0024465A50|nr:uncharacterized protein LOC129591428 [Paramacrobiotus metropolitanus]XP_055343047.1 uncharacterized protein LOC129591428 [Paramacrobiotus metropolitanus]